MKEAALSYSVPDAAEVIGISLRAMWRLLETHKIPKVKVGRRTIIRRSDLEDFLSAGRSTQVYRDPKSIAKSFFR